MGSRRGRLNWSNLEIRISDKDIEKQHQFHAFNPSISTPTVVEDNLDNQQQTNTLSVATKRTWMPKSDVGEMRDEQFIEAEQAAIDEKYNKRRHNAANTKTSSALPKAVRITNRLTSPKEPDLCTRIKNLCVGEHLLNVFVCHVESYSHIFIMYGDDYNRATELFRQMNTCNELMQPPAIAYEPQEQDLVAIRHEQKWFRGQCLSTTNTDVTVLCIDSGVTISCSRNDLRRLPDTFRTAPSCCIECSLSGLPTSIEINSISNSNHNECCELLYKDRYEAVVTRLDSSNHPTIVLYYGNENINDRLLTILGLL